MKKGRTEGRKEGQMVVKEAQKGVNEAWKVAKEEGKDGRKGRR